MIDLTALTTHPVESSDQAFRLALYASTRAEELAVWHWPPNQQETFLQLQFTAQQQAYQTTFPDRDQQIVRLADVPIGAITVARRPTVIHLIDLALLPAYRHQGIGSTLLQRLCAEANRSQKPIQLQVLQTNRARQLYQRLGFVPIGEADIYCSMEWRAFTGVMA